MKYHAICAPPKLTVRKSTAIAMLEDAVLFERLCRHTWLRPIKRARTNGDFDLYAVADLEKAIDRLKLEELGE